MQPIIQVEGLSKRYSIDHAAAGGRGAYRTLRDDLARLAAVPLRRLRAGANGRREDFWALRDVTFKVAPGEVVGIIGRNGAGKSTLLKILSRITKPTSGRAVLRGRVGSLLEVGTGFHPELTGRENIFLNGAILGMSRREVISKFDDIVAFSGVEKFLDVPVKRYSSGMHVRLAFAVAAHMEPEILIVDEVLAVGDAEFQRKCMGRMQDISRQGRTVLFVSHHMASLQALCSRGILLIDGRIVADEPIEEAIGQYLGMIEQGASSKISERTDRRGSGPARLVGLDIAGAHSGAALTTGMPARFAFHLTGSTLGLGCLFTIYDYRGQPIAHCDSRRHGPQDTAVDYRAEMFACEFDELTLLPGRYRLNVALFLGDECQDHVEGAAVFAVEPGCVRGRSVALASGYGSVHLPHCWEAPGRLSGLSARVPGGR